MPRPLKAEIFTRLQEAQANLQSANSEAARVAFQIAELERQQKQLDAARAHLQSQVQLLQELSQIASQEEPNAATT